KKASRKKRAIEDKESQRWLTGSEVAGQLSEAGAAKVTVVGDRENDIYEAFALKPDNVELLIRASHDRALVLDNEKGKRLFAHVAGQAEAGRFEVELAATPGRKKRKAQLAIRYGHPAK
ncbi:MAG: transposase, partial [Pseudomonadota bacterium]